MAWLYAITILLGSCLLFLVQPMCGKMLLPVMGGSPAAWTTCMVFFQAGLLVGYAYAHAGPRWLGVRVHGIIHLVLLIAAGFLLPIHLPDEAPADWHPVLWLLAALTLAAGLPYALLAAGAPLLQRWYASRAHASDPYFLYAASNIGSFVGLALFPFVFEPFLGLPEQNDVWRWCFIGSIVLLAICVPWHAPTPRPAMPGHGALTQPRSEPTWMQRGRWILLALIPSSLLLSVTTHLTTDVAPIPLLWVIPMALYLATFVIAFAGKPIVSHTLLDRWMPVVVIVLVTLILAEAGEPMYLVLGIPLLGFGWLALVCHGALARTRPAADHLTDFYLCLAAGGVLGGALNALIAPLIFLGLAEYPLMIALACLVGRDLGLSPTRDDWIWAGFAAGTTLALVAAFQWLLPLDPGPIAVAAMFGLPLVAAYMMHRHPARFGLAIAGILAASGFYHGIHGASAYRERSYFAIHRVTELNGFRRLIHGHIVHGQQSLDPAKRHLPLTYYSHDGPIGEVFAALKDDPRTRKVGLVGLGAGSLAAYSRAGDEWTFFEIDPSVKRIAENPDLFTYLSDARGKIGVEIGDARVRLKQSPQSFGLLVVDAFGSDAIPVHLLTREAMQIYFARLEANGILAFHISNDHVELEPVLAALAKDAGCVAMTRLHDVDRKEIAERGVMPSQWLIVARRQEDFPAGLTWQKARPRPDLKVWTDDSSNLFQVLR
jgi:hypothetical protein